MTTIAIDDEDRIKVSLDKLKYYYNQQRHQLDGRWILIENTSKSVQYHSDCMSIFELLDIEESVFLQVHKSRWRNKLLGVGSGFQVETLNNVKFLTVCQEEGHDYSTAPTSASIVKKNNSMFTNLGRLVREGVETHFAAEAMYDDGNEEGEEEEEAEEEETPDVDMSMDSDYGNATTQERQRALDYTDGDAAMDTSDNNADKMDTNDDNTKSNAATASSSTAAATASMNTADIGSVLDEIDKDTNKDDSAETTTTKKRKGSRSKIPATITGYLKDVVFEDSSDEAKQVVKKEVIDIVLFDDSGLMRKDVTGHLISALHKNDRKIDDHEMRLGGCLVKKALDANPDNKNREVKSITLKSFKKARPFTMAVVPQVYNASKTTPKPASLERNKRRHKAKVREWLDLLPSVNMMTYAIISFLSDNLDKAREVVKYFYNRLFRLDVLSTAAFMLWSGIKAYSLKKAARFLKHDTGGIRHFSNADTVANLKKDWWNENLSTVEYAKVNLNRIVKTKGGKFERTQEVTVVRIRPAEHMIGSAEDLMRRGLWKRGEERFDVPWNVHSDFDDYSLVKFQIDAGNGSTKMIENFVNVVNPQSREHVRLVFEFHGVKDTAYNVKKAAFYDGSTIKSDVEMLAQRRVIMLPIKVNVSSDETITQIIMAANTDTQHDNNNPRPLPKPSGLTNIQAESISDENKIGIVTLDFTAVRSIQVLHDGVDTVLGLSFFGEGDGNCIASSLFRKPIKTSQSVEALPISVNQILTACVLSADLAFLSTWIGHQGASAKYPCCFCLALLSAMIRTWDRGGSPDFEARTAEMIMNDYNQFVALYENQKQNKKSDNKLRARITQQFSHSIVLKAMCDGIPFEIYMIAALHVRLGFSRTLLDFTFDWYKKIEMLYKGLSPKLFVSIQLELDKLVAYETWLVQYLVDFQTSLAGKDTKRKELMTRLEAVTLYLSVGTISQAKRQEYDRKLSQVEDELKTLDEEEQEQEEELDFAALLSEQLAITKENIKHLTKLLNKHVSITHTIIVQVLKKHGVDIQVYFSGVINGPHCFQLAQNSVMIMEEIADQMLEEFGDDTRLRTAICKFKSQMIAIFSPWYDIMQAMTSTKRMSDDDIAKFETDVGKARDAIIDLIVDNPPLTCGCGNDKCKCSDRNPLSLPTTIKSHILFATPTDESKHSHAMQQLRNFRTFGQVDEQNGETAHADVNQLLRQFGNIRGKRQKKLWVRDFHWRNNGVVLETIDEMKKATSRKKSTAERSAPQPGASDDARDTSDIVEHVLGDDELFPTAELNEDELEMNDTEELRGPTNDNHADYDSLPEESKKLLDGMDTRIVACAECGMRFVGSGACNIHYHNVHDTKTSSELDAGDITMSVTLR